RLHGSYEVMRGGQMNEAFVDFTGGVGEVLYLRQGTPGLFTALRHALAKESLVGVTALSDRGEYRTEDGLVKGHAYSVTGMHKVSLGFTKVRLLRLRNPWRVEWNGAWSDTQQLSIVSTKYRDCNFLRLIIQYILIHFFSSFPPPTINCSFAFGSRSESLMLRWRLFYVTIQPFDRRGFFHRRSHYLSVLNSPHPTGPLCALGARPGAAVSGAGRRGEEGARAGDLVPLLLRAEEALSAHQLQVLLSIALEPGELCVWGGVAGSLGQESLQPELDPLVPRALVLIHDPAGRPQWRVLWQDLWPGSRHSQAVKGWECSCCELTQNHSVRVNALKTLTMASTQDVPIARAHTRNPGEIGLRTCKQLLQCFGHGRSLALPHFQQLWGCLLEWQVPLLRFRFKGVTLTYTACALSTVLSSLSRFHLNNQLTQLLTSCYRDSRLRVDFERFVSCVAQLTCIFRHCSQHLDGSEGVVCLTHRQWMEVATFS
uniref:Calpain catalytic domain-containing protein n=1 Tax=Loxodonta africana TaxID=9785 RepID=G3UGM0_LOXAF